MIDFGFQIQIDRPVQDVFAYLTDPANLPEWQRTAEVVPLTDGPVRAGSRFREVHVVAGRRLESTTEVSALEPGRRFDVRMLSGPIPVHASWRFEPAGERTVLHFRAHGELSGAKRLLAPLLALGGRRQMRAHHERLRRALEGRDRQPA